MSYRLQNTAYIALGLMTGVLLIPLLMWAYILLIRMIGG